MECFLNLNKTYSFLFIFCLLAFSCNDDEGMDVDQTAPNIEVSTPASNAVFESGDDIDIVISLADESDIVSYTVLVTNSITSEEVYSKNAFPANTDVEEAFRLSLNVAEVTLFNIDVVAVDDFDNRKETNTSFTVNRKIGGDLSLDFNINYEGQVLKLFENYEYPSGETIYFTRLSFYLSDLNLYNSEGTEQLKAVDYVNMTSFLENPPAASSLYSYIVTNIKTGTYDNLDFNIGLDNALNENNHPSDFPTSHPLGLTSEHWPGWNSYVFFKLEGKIDFDNDGTFDRDVALHIGGTDAVREVVKDESIVISDQGMTNLTFDLDISEIFVAENGEIYDIEANPSIHNLDQMEQVRFLADNLSKAINF